MNKINFPLPNSRRISFLIEGEYMYIQFQEDTGNNRWVNESDMWIDASNFDKFADAIEQVKKLLVLA